MKNWFVYSILYLCKIDPKDLLKIMIAKCIHFFLIENYETEEMITVSLFGLLKRDNVYVCWKISLFVVV